jgi:hypothetical protein
MSNQLFEYFDPKRAGIVVEALDGKNGKKDLYMSGIFVQAEQKNQNGRVYPLREINNAVVDVNRRVSEGESVMGELDHPEELSINLDRVSHVITEMWMQGNDGYGKLKIIATPCGQIAQSLLENGVRLGVSSRGSGNVAGNGFVSDFDMITVDIVAQPSAQNAFPKSIYESLYNMRGGSKVMEIAKAISHNETGADRHLQREILSFIKELRK